MKRQLAFDHLINQLEMGFRAGKKEETTEQTRGRAEVEQSRAEERK